MERLTNCRVAFRAQVLDHRGMILKLIPFVFLFINQVSQAAIVINSVVVGGSSRSISLSATQWQVYGAFIGPDESNTESTTYNNCDTPQNLRFVGCNPARVNGETILSISFNDDVQFTGLRGVIVYNKTNFTIGGPVSNIALDQVPNATQGSTFVAQVKWNALCTSAGGTIQDYAAASTLAGLPTSACMVGGVPLNKSVQFGVGVTESGGAPAAEILLEIKFYTPSPFLGGFEPSNIAAALAIEGADGFVNKPGKFGVALTGLSGASGTSNTSPNPVGSAESYQGFVDYQIKPSDEKIRIESRDDIANTLDTYGGSITASELVVPIRGFILYLSNTSFAATQPWLASSSVDAVLNTPGNISSGFDDNSFSSSAIKNEVPVFSRMATIDDSGSVTHLFSDNMLAANCPLPVPPSMPAAAYYRYFIGGFTDNDPMTPETGSCPYATIPSLITGILEDDINCFVASALKGSPYDYQVLALREFRNRFLKSSSLGRSFIDFYYEHGPKAAQWINNNPQYKPVLRVLLWPAYFVAFVFNSLGGLLGLGIMLIIILTPATFLTRRRRQQI